MIPNKQQSECSFQLEPSSPVFLDEIVKKCDLGFQIGQNELANLQFIRATSVRDKIGDWGNFFWVQEESSAFKKTNRVISKYSFSIVENENNIVISEAMDGSFVDRYQSVAGSWAKRLYHFGANDDRYKLEYD